MALSENDSVKSCAALALGEIGNPKAVKPLIQILSDENPEVRRNAALALGAIGDQKAVKSLTVGLQDGDETVRVASAWTYIPPTI